MISVLIFILILAILVLVHEWGHFIVAKKSGLVVEEFGFGFPPKIFGWKIGKTLYSINLLPLGGFVKILGEDGTEANNPESFASRSVGTRSLIIIGGVLMNFLLATFIFILGYNIGLPTVIDETNIAKARNVAVQIVAVAPESPAVKAGLTLGDIIKKFNNTEIKEISELQNYTKTTAGNPMKLLIQRGSEIRELYITPRSNPPTGEGPLGIVLVKIGIVSFPWYQSIWLGTKSAFLITWTVILGFFSLLKNLILAGRVPLEIAGPVGIAVLTKQAAGLGFAYLMQLVAIISINLAVLNLVPFPALDGGRLLFLGIEKIKGSKVNPKIENTIHGIGLALLLLLIVLITWRDILRLK